MKLEFEQYKYRFGWISWVISLLAITFLVLAFLPIQLFSNSLARATHCKVILNQANGTIWQGSAALGFAEPNISNNKICNPPYALTERFSWEGFCSISQQQCHLRILHDHLAKPLNLTLRAKMLIIESNSIELPGNILEILGSPWSSLHPRGEIKLEWSDLFWTQTMRGTAELQFRDMSSAISPIKPLGSYALKFLMDSDLKFELTTLNGPLILNGQGQLQNHQISFNGDATAAPESKASLIGLLSIIGNREGEVYRFKI
jgi:general secretion pathway protein N